MTTDPQTDYDGCNSECRKAGAHTLRWGGCEHAVEPEPTVSMSVVYRDHDGQNSIGFDVYTVDQLAELLDPVLGTAAMRSRSGSVDLPHLAAHAIVHRNDDPAVSSAVARSAPALPAGSGLDPGRKAAAARRAALEAAIWDAGGGDLDQDDVDRFLARVLAELPAADRPAEEAYRLALSTALRLGTGANWEAIRDRAEDLVAEVGQLTETSRRLLEQRQEMAAERFAWQERGDQAEARVRQMEAAASVDRAAVLREEAVRIRAHCPDHLDSNSADGSWMVCHCAVADDLERGMAVEAQQQTETPACPDPIECGHEAALGQAQQEVKRLGLMVDEYGHGASTLSEKLQEARATNRRLNLRAQRLESELATYRKAVADWKISETGAYVPLRTLAAIAKAAGVTVPGGWELHYERVERLEAAASVVSSVGQAAHTTRSAVLREAAEVSAAQNGCPCNTGHTIAYLLRRMADETQPAEAEDGETVLLRLTVDAVEEGRRELRTENARLRAQLWTLAAALDGLHTLIATSSRDWQTYRVDAWLWAVLCGWDCEQAVHDETCTHGALEETAAMHGWDDDTVAKARRYRAAVRILTEPAVGAPQPTEA